MFPRTDIFHSEDEIEIITQRMIGIAASSSAASADYPERFTSTDAANESEAAVATESSTFTVSTHRRLAHYGNAAKSKVAKSALATKAVRISFFSLFLLFVAFVALDSNASRASASPFIHNAQGPVHYAELSSPNSNNAAALYLRFRKGATMNQAQEYVEPFIRFRKSFSPTAPNLAKIVMKSPTRRMPSSAMPGYDMSFDVIDNEYRY